MTSRTHARWATLAITAALAAAFAAPARAEQTDDRSCKDHPLFTRMPTYWIHNCSVKEFDAHAFRVGNGKTESVEGRTTTLNYYPQATATSRPSDLQIVRNYENAVKALGGREVASAKGWATFELVRDGKDLWVDLSASFTGRYEMTIVERQAMSQDVQGNAGAFSGDLARTGHAAVYGIYFDTGRTDLKPESEHSIGEIAKLLAADPALSLYVVGNTDNVGGLDANMKLSQGRAEAVVASLTGKHGIAAARLRAFGVGPLAPVAANDAEDGRAKNRRVELVKP